MMMMMMLLVLEELPYEPLDFVPLPPALFAIAILIRMALVLLVWDPVPRGRIVALVVAEEVKC